MEPDKKSMQDVFPPSRSSDRSIRHITLNKEPRRREPMAPVLEQRHIKNTMSYSHTERGMEGGRHYGLWALAALLVAIVLFVAFSFIWSGAKVTITPKSVTALVDGTFVAQKTAGEGVVPFEVMTVSRDASRSVSAQGTETVNESASGTIVVYNAYSTGPQKLIANTRFATPEGLIYRIHEAISVPGLTKKGTAVTPGSIEVVVYADKAGTDYNIGLSDFSIPGLKGDPREKKVYARSKTPMTGGFSGTRPKINETDLKTAQAAMEQELSLGLKADANGQIPDGYVLFPDALSISFEPLSSEGAGDNSSVTIKEKGTLTGVLFAKDKLASAVITSTHTSADEGVPVSLADAESLSFTILDKASVKPASDDRFSFTLSGPAKLVWGFDEKAFREDLAGKEKGALQTVLSGYPGIDTATVSLRPFWQSSFPKAPEKITIETLPLK